MVAQEKPHLGQVPVSGLLRRARRIAGFSQRDLARRAGISQAAVAKVERGECAPSLDTLQRMLDAAGLYLVVVDADGRVIQPLEEFPLARDAADRRYPAHLDLIIDPEPGEWWGTRFGLARPPETYLRDPQRVARQRLQSRHSRANLTGPEYQPH